MSRQRCILRENNTRPTHSHFATVLCYMPCMCRRLTPAARVITLLMSPLQPAEMDAVFNEIDDDGSGELEIEELKVALKNLQDEAVNVVKAEKEAVKEVAELKKAAKASLKQAHEVKEEAEEEHEARVQKLQEAAAAAEVAKAEAAKAAAAKKRKG